MEGSLITTLIWLMVLLGAVAIGLGLMTYVARRRYSNGDDHDDDHEPPPRPARGSHAAPLKLKPQHFRGLRLADFHNDARAMRDFGELVTVAALAGEGWKKLPSRIQGGQGLDLLFVREVKGAGGYEALAIEVRTVGAAHHEEALSDERVASALGRLHDIGAFDGAMLEELLRGLWQGPPFFRKEIWHHQLDTGFTTITEVDEVGNRMTSRPHRCAHLMDALYQMIKQLDRKADYVDRPVVEVAEGELVHASARRRRKNQPSFFTAATRVFTFTRRPPKKRA